MAEDNLRLGHGVIADSVNPDRVDPRRLGRRRRAGPAPPVLRVELICSDTAEHRRRVEERRSQGPGLRFPDWAAVQAREYHPWTEADLRLDTALETVESATERIARTCRPARARR